MDNLRKMTNNDLLEKLMGDGHVAKEPQSNKAVRLRDQSEIGRLKKIIKSLEGKLAAVESEKEMLICAYQELAQ